ncbi:MAG: Na+:H+ antiporter, NhaA family [Microbacteriaceae bacterium]|jgi:NhaA family Na+:H+ antiporter|nr:Na+/H+ antiporter NhaA [Microbacteriaceae bacterium]MDQ1549367.1 Na+:H+ antiporter, NhaA family [Microbacteriaceae bacterium]MDQ1553405.1 Na+:H+ antiporter, NhaA family [Microbacteriaceae bacterium]
MRFLRSERYAAFLLIGAAALGLILANTPWGPAVMAARDFHLPLPGLDLSVGHWVTDGLLAIFFFLAAIELRHELSHGELDSPQKALVPALAAVGGVIAPALIFLAFVREPGLSSGWPIPTATDIAFALGVLAIAGRGLPARIRALLLGVAVIDDLIAILIIAFFFTTDLNPVPLLLAIPVVLLFGWVSRQGGRRASGRIVVALIVLGIVAWMLVYFSGIHSTVAGVALGLAMGTKNGARARYAIEPYSNGVILPLFAFVAALVALPAVGIGGFSPVFWAIVVALPVGKLIGITGGAVIARSLAGRKQLGNLLSLGDIVAVAGLGGVGFTVSLLMNELAYRNAPVVAVEGTLAVLVASIVAGVIGVLLVVARTRHYRTTRSS